MKELNDTEFDQIFKFRIAQELPEFEEGAWLKMEQKLRKKDRLLFYRNASIVLLFLSFGLGFYYLNKSTINLHGPAIVLEDNTKPAPNNNPAIEPSLTNTDGIASTHRATKIAEVKIAKKDSEKNEHNSFERKVKIANAPINTDFKLVQNVHNNELKKIFDQTTVQSIAQVSPTAQPIKNPQNEVLVQAQQIAQVEQAANESILEATDPSELSPDGSEKKKVTTRVRKKIPISLAISAGPDFNSASAIIGGKTSIAFGLSVGVGITKRLSIETGIGFGMKNYSGDAATYSFASAKQTTTPSNPYAPISPTTITAINAACKVLEVPLLASFELSNNQKRSISFNAGLSSYFMLKEEYVYKYTEASGKKDRTNEFTNANQHILSVVNLSATYNLKLKNKKLGFGIAPYVKIPLTGIGEGNVPLKSSGISLKLQYDVNKK